MPEPITELVNSMIRMEEVQHDQTKKLDRIYEIVVGDGGQDAITTRLLFAEKEIDYLKGKINKVDDLESIIDAWKNRAIGFSLAGASGGGLLGAIISKIVN